MTTSKEQLRVLFITRAYGQSAGGMERLSYELINEMKKQPNISPIILAHTTRLGISLLQARIESVLFLLTAIPGALLNAHTADVVHLGDPVLSLLGWLIKKIYRKPVVVTVHGLDVSYSNKLYQMYLGTYFQSFDAYVSISAYAAERLKRWHVTGDITIIPPGAHDAMYSPNIARDELARLLKRDISQKKVLGTVGRLVARKGHAWFISNVLPKLSSEYIYCIAGDGPERGTIINTAKTAGVEDRVVMLGRVSPENLTIIMNTIDMYVQPNIPVEGDAEGFGIVMLEAALCEQHVLASNLEGIPDAVSDGNNGELVAPQDADAWVSAITNIEAGSKNPNARLYTLEHLGWKSLGKRYLDIFTKLSARS